MDPLDIPLEVDPFTLFAERHGWRGLSLPVSGVCDIRTDWRASPYTMKRRCIQSYRGIRRGSCIPLSGPPPRMMTSKLPPRKRAAPPRIQPWRSFSSDSSGVRANSAKLDRLARGTVQPRIIVDVLLPPFKTTIDAPDVREKKTVVGQWFD
jgi:hypothetical protein